MISVTSSNPGSRRCCGLALPGLAASGRHRQRRHLAALTISRSSGLALPGAPTGPVSCSFRWDVPAHGLNAVDGMLAREFGHKSPSEPISTNSPTWFPDAAPYLPFVAVAPSAGAASAPSSSAALSEMTGALGSMVGARGNTTAPWEKRPGRPVRRPGALAGTDRQPAGMDRSGSCPGRRPHRPQYRQPHPERPRPAAGGKT